MSVMSISLQSRRGRGVSSDELVVAVVTRHAESLLRVARRYTDCAADAEDAYQRAMEVFVKSAHRLDPATAHKWLHTVLKHECFAVREQRAKLVGVEDEQALDALDDGRHLASVEERSERFEELARAAEALRQLKPQEVTALVLKAQGLSYNEIAERENWTYTKVNRCITEGRRAFLARVAGIESGEECRRWAPVLSAMADGEAKPRDVLAVRPHLRNCAGCRASLGEMRRAPAAAAALLPAGILGPRTGGGIVERLSELALAAQERVVAPLVKAQSAVEAAGAGKFAAVAASTVALAGGGVAVQRSSAGEPPSPPQSPAAQGVAPAAAPAPEREATPAPHPERILAPHQASSPPRASEPPASSPPAPRPEDEFAWEGDAGTGEADVSPAEPAPGAAALDPAPADPAPAGSSPAEDGAEFGVGG